MPLIPTSSQTVGPFFNFGLTTNKSLGRLAKDGAAGERIRLSFRVTDGNGDPTAGDAMIELWQADASGNYVETAQFTGFGRLETEPDGICIFETVKPGRIGRHAPHINVTVFARGLLKHLRTRVYFEGDAANAEDEILTLVPEARRATLMAKPVSGSPGAWHLDIRLQGEGETVFFDV